MSCRVPVRRQVAIAVACIFLLVAGCNRKPHHKSARDVAAEMPRHAAKAHVFPPLMPADAFEATDIYTDLDAAITPGRNLIYCATAGVLPESLSGTVENSSASNGNGTLSNGIATDGLFAAAGTSHEILKTLANNRSVSDAILHEIESDSPIALIYLKKSLPFFESFERLHGPISFHSKDSIAEIAGFGWEEFANDSFSTSLQRDQVTILDDKSDDDFVIRLNTESEHDELILAKVSPASTLGATFESVRRRVQNSELEGSERAKLEDGEKLMVPIVDVNVRKIFETSPPTIQLIQFRLDEKGAALESAYYTMGIHDLKRRRRFVFDRPFLLYLKTKEDDSPYFVVWIENSELLDAYVRTSESQESDNANL